MTTVVEAVALAMAERDVWKDEPPVYEDNATGRRMRKHVAARSGELKALAVVAIEALAAHYAAMDAAGKKVTLPDGDTVEPGDVAAALRAALSEGKV